MISLTRLPTWGRRLVLLTVLGSLIGAAAWYWQAGRQHRSAPLTLTVAVPMQTSAAAVMVAQERQLFQRHGLTVSLKSFLIGKQALEAVLDGQADLALVADVPFVQAVLRGKQIAALATVFESRKAMAIFGHAASGIGGVTSLGGKRVGTVAGTNAEYFLDNLLDAHGIARATVSTVYLEPGHLSEALAEGRVDAVTAWNPDLARLEAQYGKAGVTIFGEDFFVYRFLLVGKTSYLDSHPEQVGRILATFQEGNGLIRAEPAQARALLGRWLAIAPALLARAFNPDDYVLTLDQSLLLALSDQARWLRAKQSTGQQAVPDFLESIRAEPLTALAPAANKLIR